MRSALLPMIACILATFCSCANGKTKSCCAPGEVPGHSVALVNHGSHVGLLLRREEIPDGAIPELEDLPSLEYVELGWGDAGYYPHPDPGLAEGLSALFFSGGSVLHVAALSSPLERELAVEETLGIPLCAEGFSKLVRFVSRSFLRRGARRSEPLGEGWYGVSRFYPSERDFSIRNTCNTWVADALREAGCPVRGRPTVSSALVGEARRFAEDEKREREMEDSVNGQPFGAESSASPLPEDAT